MKFCVAMLCYHGFAKQIYNIVNYCILVGLYSGSRQANTYYILISIFISVTSLCFGYSSKTMAFINEVMISTVYSAHPKQSSGGRERDCMMDADHSF